MIAGVTKRVRRFTNKHGAELPTSVTHNKRLYEMNGNTLWMDTVKR